MANNPQPPTTVRTGGFQIETPDLDEVVVPDGLGTILVRVRDLAGNDRYSATLSEIGSLPGVFISTGPLLRQGTTNLFSARFPVGAVPSVKPPNNNKTVAVQGFLGSVFQGSLSNDFIAWSGGSGSGSFLASTQPGEGYATGEPTPVALRLQFGPSARAGSDRPDQPTTLVYSRGPHFAGCWFSAPLAFGADSAPAFWVLQKCDGTTWALLLRRGRIEIVRYRLNSAGDNDSAFPLALQLDSGAGEGAPWPSTATVSPAP